MAKYFFKKLIRLRTKVLQHLSNKLRDYVTSGFWLYSSSTFIYELILIIISVNAKIMKTQNNLNIKHDPKGYLRSHKVNFM